MFDTPDHPASRIFDITPANSDLPVPTKAIFVGGAGNLVLIALNDTAQVTLAVGAGAIIPVRARQVRTGTTATGLVGLA